MKTWLKFAKIIVLIFCAFAIIARFINIDNLPIFHDEAIYINAARKISITKISTWKSSFENEIQKPPLILLLAKTVINNSDTDLIKTRQLSAIFGIFTILILYLLIKDFFGATAALISVALFSLSPFLFFYQRLYIFESFLLFFYLFSLYFYLLVLKKFSISKAVFLFILAFILAGLKQSIYLWVPSLLIFPFLKIKLKDFTKIIRPLLIFLFGLIIGLIFFIILSQGSYFSPGDTFIIKNLNFNLIFKNCLACIIWMKSYLTTFGFLLTVFILISAFILQIGKKRMNKVYLFSLLIFLPLLVQSIIANYFLPRYIFLSFALFLIFLAWQLNYLIKKNKLIFISCCLGLILSFAYFDFQLLYDPISTPLHQNESWQYVSGAPSGWGVKEISEYILSNNPRASIASIGVKMMPSSALDYYLATKDIKITEYSGVNDKDKIWEEYLVFQNDLNNNFQPPSGYEKILEFRKPLGDATVYLYKNLHMAKI